MRYESKPHLLCRGPAFALYALIDAIVDQYFPVVGGLEQELDAIRDGAGFDRWFVLRSLRIFPACGLAVAVANG